MKKFIPLENISSLEREKIFCDANILIYLFCPLSNCKEFIIKKYSNVFKKILLSSNKMHVDFIVLSEFINRFLRIAFDVYKKNNNLSHFQFKKDYRSTDDYKENVNLVAAILNNKIPKFLQIENKTYNNNTMNDIISRFKNEKSDINDFHIVELCKEKNMLLLTHDGDFKNSDIRIISGNNIYQKFE